MDHKRPEHISGYVHPETAVSSKAGTTPYSVYKKGNGQKSVYASAPSSSVYKIVNTESDDSNTCPKCSEKAEHCCNCIYNDKKCSNGHIWYSTRDGSVKLGNPHKTN